MQIYASLKMLSLALQSIIVISVNKSLQLTAIITGFFLSFGGDNCSGFFLSFINVMFYICIKIFYFIVGISLELILDYSYIFNNQSFKNIPVKIPQNPPLLEYLKYSPS